LRFCFCRQNFGVVGLLVVLLALRASLGAEVELLDVITAEVGPEGEIWSVGVGVREVWLETLRCRGGACRIWLPDFPALLLQGIKDKNATGSYANIDICVITDLTHLDASVACGPLTRVTASDLPAAVSLRSHSGSEAHPPMSPFAAAVLT
jgi:hypothetical protein